MSWNTVWEEVFSSRPWGKYPGEDLIRFVAKNFYKVEDRASVKILEVGCGTGANLWYLAREGFSVFGIDGSPSGVDITMKRLNAEIPDWNGEVLQGDIIKLPYTDNFFDGVIDIEALCCNDWDSTKRIIQEIWRVLKPNGKFFSRTFANGCWGDETGKRLSKDCWDVSEGPMLGLGLVRFLHKNEIEDLYAPFSIDSTELYARTMENGRKEVREWAISANKDLE